MPFDINKLRNGIEMWRREGSAKKPVVLMTSGSFAPPHRMHIELLEVSKKWLEARGKEVVVGGFVCPSSDSYVKRKLGDDWVCLKDV